MVNYIIYWSWDSSVSRPAPGILGLLGQRVEDQTHKSGTCDAEFSMPVHAGDSVRFLDREGKDRNGRVTGVHHTSDSTLLIVDRASELVKW